MKFTSASKYVSIALFALLTLLASLDMAPALAMESGAMAGFVPPTEITPPGEEPVQYNDATFVSQSLPTTMYTGQTYSVSVTMRNAGTLEWDPYSDYRLGSINPYDNLTWGVGRVTPSATTYAGGQRTFTFQVTAPTTPGTYNFQWRMLQEAVEWFGQATPNVAITVMAPPPINDAVVVGQSIPASMVSGNVYPVSVTMRNTGNTTWTPSSGYGLGSQNPENNNIWGGNRATLSTSVAPGQQYTFNFSVTAPAPGSYTMQWRTLREYYEWFGGIASSPVTVTAPPVKPTLNVARTPSTLVAGQTSMLSWSSANATSLSRVCTAAGTGFNSNESLAVNGSRTEVAQAYWVGYPSSCTWTVYGPGGSQAYAETMTTTAAPTPLPTISVQRTPAEMTASQPYTLTWSTTNATSLTKTCTASATGYAGNETLQPNGSSSGTASVAWVNNPSTCIWTATGSGGTARFTETMTTNSAATDVITYIHTDGLGSPVARTNAAGNVISKTQYEPYGNTVTGAAEKIGFTGHVSDATTGLVYMQQRYYDPIAGRFLSTDPVTAEPNDGTSFNRYSYAENSPYQYIDPDGRSSICAASISCGIITPDQLQMGSSNFASLSPAAKTGAVLGGLAGAGVAAGCDVLSAGGCAPANPGMVGLGITGGAVLGAVTGQQLDRAWAQLDGLLRKAVATGPQEAQYALIATKSGLYPDVRQGLIHLNAGDVWKYGTSNDPGGRYPVNALGTFNLRMEQQYFGTKYQVLAAEKIKLIGHAMMHGSLPPGNRIFK